MQNLSVDFNPATNSPLFVQLCRSRLENLRCLIVWLSVDEGLLRKIEKEGEGVQRGWVVACRDVEGLERDT